MHLEGIGGATEHKHDYIYCLPESYHKLAKCSMNKKKKDDEVPVKKSFNWIFGRTA